MEGENNKIVYIKAYLSLKSWDETYLSARRYNKHNVEFANLNTQKSKAI